MPKQMMVEVSARHVHVSREDLDVLFGKNFELSVKKELSQPGQFASNEVVDLVSEKDIIHGVRILGPIRSQSQVELAQTDARKLGVNAPLRLSGDLTNSAPIKIIGPVGSVELKEGVIIAKRHFHCIPETAKEMGLNNGDIIMVKVGEKGFRQTIFDDVEVRVSETAGNAIHIDTDEGNACSIGGICSIGEIL